MPSTDFFYALEGKSLYKCFVTDKALSGAKVASNMYDDNSVTPYYGAFGLLGLILGRMAAKRVKRKRDEKESLYDTIEPGSQTFLAADKANFSWTGFSISQVIAREKASGIKAVVRPFPLLQVNLTDGTQRKFVLVNLKAPDSVMELITKITPNVSVE